MIQFVNKKHLVISTLLVISTYSSIYAWSAITGSPSSYNLLGSPGDNLSATVWNDTVKWLKIVSDNTRNVFSDGTNVGIGATAGTNKLEVTGDLGIKSGSALRIYRTDNASYGVINYSAGNTLGMGVAGSPNNLVIESTGNVGIGGSPSTDKFRVTATAVNNGAVFTNGTRSVKIIPGNAGAAANNPIVAANDNIITFNAGSINTGNLVIAPWSSTIGGIRINNSGNVSIGTTTVSGTLKLDVEGTIGASQYCDQNGANCFTAASSTLSGAGTSGYIPRYNGSSSLTAGTIQDNGSNIGVGKAPSVSVRLDINGKIAANNYTGVAGSINTNSLEVGGASPNATNGDGTIFFHDNGDIAHQLRYTAGTLFWEGAGNGYGTSTVPTFQVGGSIFAGINGGGVAIGAGSITPGVKLDVLGDAKIRGTQINNDALEVSTYNSGNRWAYVDFHGDDTYTDFSLRLLRDNGGPNGASWLHHRGTGPLYVYTQEGGPIRMSTNSTERLTILGGGNIGLFNNNPVARFQIGNNVATGPMDNYNEYQILLYDAGTAAGSYGIGVRGSTLLFNSASLTDFDVAGVNKVSISGSSFDLKAGNSLRFFDTDSSNFVALKPASVLSGNVTWTLPTTDGSANAVLATNGAGQLSWVGLGGGGNAKSVKKLSENKNGGQYFYNCAVMGDDSVKCWSYDGHGQVGDGNPSLSKVFPQTIPLPGAVDKLYMNTGNAYALLANGTVYAWGYNGSGENGNASTAHQFLPVRVGTLTGITKLAISGEANEVSGNSACALNGTSGALWCWGYNGYGNVGNNSTTAATSPVQIFTNGIADVYDGMGYVGGFCVKKTDSSTACWGYNGYGVIGDNSTTQRLVPTNSSITNVSKMASFGDYPNQYGHRCAVKTDGTLWCWGNNSNGQLCLGDTTQRNVPTQVGSIGTSAVDVTVGLLNTWIRMSDGTVRACGYNSYGQLGNGNTTQSTTPVTPTGLTGVTKIVTMGDDYGGWYISVCYLINNGTVKCAGYNGYGQLGDNSTTARSTATQVVGITNAVDIVGRGSASTSRTCALLSSGVMKCWGYNGHGELGNGTTTSMYIPQDVLF